VASLSTSRFGRECQLLNTVVDGDLSRTGRQP